MTRDVPAPLLTRVEVGDPSASPVLVLHGGAGPASLGPLTAHLAMSHRVLVPTHPGWDGTHRPASLNSVRALAGAYLELLEEGDLRDVVVVGSSFGGWVASRLALDDADARVGALVLIDAIGPDVPGHAPRPPGELPPAPHPSGVGPSGERPVPGGAGPSPANLAALRAYTRGTLTEPGLLAALASVSVPVLVLWGEDDQVVTPAFGRAYSAAFPDAQFQLIPNAGHLPVRDVPDVVSAAIDAFTSKAPTRP